MVQLCSSVSNVQHTELMCIIGRRERAGEHAAGPGAAKVRPARGSRHERKLLSAAVELASTTFYHDVLDKAATELTAELAPASSCWLSSTPVRLSSQACRTWPQRRQCSTLPCALSCWGSRRPAGCAWWSWTCPMLMRSLPRCPGALTHTLTERVCHGRGPLGPCCASV